MLLFEGKNIQEISYELDFGSPSWFIKRFKIYYGMTPKQFQKLSKSSIFYHKSNVLYVSDIDTIKIFSEAKGFLDEIAQDE